MSDYPKDTEGRKKALAANTEFHKPLNSKLEKAKKKIINAKEEIDFQSITVGIFPSRVNDFLHNASWHLTQALKIIDEDEK